MFEEKYIFRLKEKLSRDEVFALVGKEFEKNDIVTKDFIEALKKRENTFPTGIILENNTPTAISHTDDKYVFLDKIAIVISDFPIIFKNIENGTSDVPCKVFFIMALTKQNKNDILMVLTELLEEHEAEINNFRNMTNKEILNFLI